MLTEGLLALMNGCPPLTNIVGNRIYPVVLPKNPTVPAATFYLVTSKNDAALDRTFATLDQIEINVWALSYHDATYGQQALHALLDMYQGTLPDGTVVLYTASNDNPDSFEKDSLLYRCSTTFSFLH